MTHYEMDLSQNPFALSDHHKPLHGLVYHFGVLGVLELQSVQNHCLVISPNLIILLPQSSISLASV